MANTYKCVRLEPRHKSDDPNCVCEAMRITQDQKIGIGTSVPGYKLEVNGDTKIGGNCRVEDYIWVKGGLKDDGGDYGSDGQVLSTNGNGQVHWENLTWEDLPNVSSLSALP